MQDVFEAIARSLADNETALADLYATFARAFPEDAPLWAALADDERHHASAIGEVRQSVTAGAVRPDPGAVRREAIESMTRYVHSIGDRCRRGEIARIQACALARDLENSMLEKNLFRVLGVGPAAVTALQELLAAQTLEHRRKIDETLARLRRA